MSFSRCFGIPTGAKGIFWVYRLVAKMAKEEKISFYLDECDNYDGFAKINQAQSDQIERAVGVRPIKGAKHKSGEIGNRLRRGLVR